MKAAFMRTLINPTIPVNMHGYGPRVAHGQYDDLQLNSVLVQDEGVPLLIHVLDTIIITKSYSDYIKTKIFDEFGITKDNIFIVATHTHSGPKLLSIDNPEDKSDYQRFVTDSIMTNTRQCLSRLQDVHVFLKSHEVNGLYSNRNDASLPHHKEVVSLVFRNPEGDGIFQLVNTACHPTVLNAANTKISADYVGVTRSYLQQTSGIPSILFNGDCGDVSTRLLRQKQNYEEVLRIGTELGKQLSQPSLEQEISLSNMKIRHVSYTVHYRAQENDFFVKKYQEFKNIQAQPDNKNSLIDMYVQRLEHMMQQNQIKFTPVSTIIDTDDLRIISFPGEIVYNLGEKLRNIDGKRTIIMAYANDFNTYAVDNAQFGKYFETFVSQYPYGAAEEMVDDIIEAARSLTRNERI